MKKKQSRKKGENFQYNSTVESIRMDIEIVATESSLMTAHLRSRFNYKINFLG